MPNVPTYGQLNPAFSCTIFLEQGQGQKKTWCGGPDSVIIGIRGRQRKCSADRLSSGAKFSSSLLGLLCSVPWELLVHLSTSINAELSFCVHEGWRRVP